MEDMIERTFKALHEALSRDNERLYNEIEVFKKELGFLKGSITKINLNNQDKLISKDITAIQKDIENLQNLQKELIEIKQYIAVQEASELKKIPKTIYISGIISLIVALIIKFLPHIP